MDYEFRVIVEKVAVASQEVVKRDTIKPNDIATQVNPGTAVRRTNFT